MLRRISEIDQNRLLARFWQSGAAFWRGRRAWTAWMLMGALVAIAIAQSLVQLNIWNRDFFNALEHRDRAAVASAAVLFLPLAAASIVLAELAVRGRTRLQRKWRESLTVHVATYWMLDCRYNHLDYAASGNKNPEYRIADDARMATDAPIDLSLGFLSSALNAATFVAVLSSIGGDFVVDALGLQVAVPGYLVFGAVIYAALATGTMMIAGRPLTQAVQDLNQAEAELRAAATVLRQRGEETAPPGAEPKKRRALWVALRQVLSRWAVLARSLSRTTLVSQGNILLAPVVAWLLCAPKYIDGAMSLGQLTQAAAAFVIVQSALNWLVDNYQRLADWRSSVNRIATLLIALDDLACAEPPVPGGEPTAAAIPAKALDHRC
jgi:ABC-type uncharacterized transport system fused permease/ATPase subunit